MPLRLVRGELCAPGGLTLHVGGLPIHVGGFTTHVGGLTIENGGLTWRWAHDWCGDTARGSASSSAGCGQATFPLPFRRGHTLTYGA